MRTINFSELDDVHLVAVAVSGGADSMALVHKLDRYAAARKASLHILALTVDHGLRPESADEAAKVGRWLKKSCPHVTHKILRWEGAKPKTGKMEAARTARYRLMAKACRDAGIGLLAVAHHADDQAETFFMRLAHGSGLDGLVGMRRIMDYDDALKIYRPFLEVGHADCVAECKRSKIKWVEDPTNVNSEYLRSRLRATLSAEGWSGKRLSATLARLDRAADALAMIAGETLQDATAERTENGYVLDLAKLKAKPFEIALRVLRVCLDDVGSARYGPRLERLEDIAANLLTATRKTRATLGGCVLTVTPRTNRVEIAREACL